MELRATSSRQSIGRQSLQPLMVAYGFDSSTVGESWGLQAAAVPWSARSHRIAASVRGGEPVFELTRSPVAETADRVTMGFLRADVDYQPGAATAVAPEAAKSRSFQTSVPIVFSEGEAKAIAERALSEGQVARDSLACALPPSKLAVTPGDLVAFAGLGASGLFRIDRIEEAGHRSVRAVRIEPEVYRAPYRQIAAKRPRVIAAQTPIDVAFLDLPLLTGSEDPVSPFVAVSKSPWAGPVAVFSSSEDDGYAFDRELARPAVFGTLLDDLPAGQPGLWMRATVRVRVASGRLQSRGEAEVLNGANVAAVQFGSVGDWEVVQFRTAELIGPNEYRLSELLRGQAGTDGVMPATWPAGSDFVLIDGAVGQVQVPMSARGLERHFRVGPAQRAYDDASYAHVVETCMGVGLRPYRPTHLSARRSGDGAIELRWMRRTRVDGDSWLGSDVPLGEDGEVYLVKLRSGEILVREVETTSPFYRYSIAEQVADEVEADVSFEVAQVSRRFGPGPFERIEFDG